MPDFGKIGMKTEKGHMHAFRRAWLLVSGLRCGFWCGLLVFLPLLGACVHRESCPRVPARDIVQEIQAQSPDSRLDVFVTDEWLLVNGAPVGKIRKGRFTDASDRNLYPPLFDALHQEFSRRGSDPYTEIVVYVHDRLPSALVELVRSTAIRTRLAPVLLIPMSFVRRTCDQASTVSPASPVSADASGLLVRQERDRILVNGTVVVQLEDGRMPPAELDSDGILCPKLLQALTGALSRLPEGVEPVLHLTLEADPDVTKYILVTAGKAGIVRFKTLRVIE